MNQNTNRGRQAPVENRLMLLTVS